MTDEDVALFCVSLMAKLGIPYDETVDEWSSARCRNDFAYSHEVCAELGISFSDVMDYFVGLDPRCDCGFFSDD